MKVPIYISAVWAAERIVFSIDVIQDVSVGFENRYCAAGALWVEGRKEN